MTEEKLKEILAHPEWTEIEYKKSQTDLARTVYESICAFLNRRGGHIVLGADDDGSVVGIEDGYVKKQIDTLTTDMNNPQLFNPTFYLTFEPLKVDGKNVIYCYVPESQQAHSYKGQFYDRNQDGDFILRGTEQIANLFIRKSKQHTEDRVFPSIAIDDLDPNAFEYLRKMVALKDNKHEWLGMSNEEILRSGRMILNDPDTGKPGISLAGVLLFGTDLAIGMALPMYKIDLLCRIRDTELYDDRLTLHCNLFRAYDQIMDFLKKHLSEVPYIEDMQRFSLRDKILREVALNLLIHREYSNSYPTTLTIWSDRIETENWNLPFQYGFITPENLKPHPKNPVIANVFSQTGLVEELGSGTRKIFKYVPLYAKGKEATIEDADVFRMTIPHPDVFSPQIEEKIEGKTVKIEGKTTEKILEAIKQKPNITTPEIAESLGLTEHAIYYSIRKLRENGRLRRVGGAKGGYWEIIKE